MIINLRVGFPLRCFQRLSIPNLAAERCRWHDSSQTRGQFIPVLSSLNPLFLGAQTIPSSLNTLRKAASYLDKSVSHSANFPIYPSLSIFQDKSLRGQLPVKNRHADLRRTNADLCKKDFSFPRQSAFYPRQSACQCFTLTTTSHGITLKRILVLKQIITQGPQVL